MLTRDHQRRGFGQWPGYHFYVTRDGTIHYCRPMHIRGCHVSGHNTGSLGVCYEGGHSDTPPPYADNRTAEQVEALHDLLTTLHDLFPDAQFCGHHDLNPHKACPCLDARREYGYVFGGR